jgi:hypothetical protein
MAECALGRFNAMNKLVRVLVLVFQVVGGVIGLGIILRALLTTNVTRTTMIIHFCFAMVFVYGILSGVLLVTRPKLGLFLSELYQAIQIPIVASPAIAYNLFSGAMFGVQVHGSGFSTNVLFGSRYFFYLNPGQPWCIGVNLLAVALLVVLHLQWRKRNA